MKETLRLLVDGTDLSREAAREAMDAIMSGGASPAQIAGFLVALRIKGETVDEIAGLAEGMRAAASPLALGNPEVVDTCGTGGDGANTFNVSTTAALILAGAGIPVAKHGNRAVSSACGSADVLEALGVRLVGSLDALVRCLDEAGIAFLFAPAQHPAMKHAIGPRQQLGLRTVFNLLGPLTNPAGARRQVVGVYDAALVDPLAEVLGRLGAVHAMVVHGAGGLDELSTLGPTRVAEWHEGVARSYDIVPGDYGIGLADPADLTGGDGEANAAIVRAVLRGDLGPHRDLVLLNAAAALHVSARGLALDEGLSLAAETIDSGAALAALDRLVAVSNAGGAT